MTSKRTKHRSKKPTKLTIILTDSKSETERLRYKRKKTSTLLVKATRPKRDKKTATTLNRQCHIHDKVLQYYTENIRNNVCINDLRLTEHTDGKYYCLFHLPTKQKNTAEFEKAFEDKKNAVEKQISELKEGFYSELNSAIDQINKIEKKLIDDPDLAKKQIALIEKQFKKECEKFEKSKSNLAYDFSYIWFPFKVDFVDYEFEVKANFQGATFAADADFINATFFMGADFNGASFLADAHFTKVRFYIEANFEETAFLSTAQIYFKETKFLTKANFKETLFEGYIIFSGSKDVSVFLDKDTIKKESINFFDGERRELKKRGIKKQFVDGLVHEYREIPDQEAVLDLQNARLENPERITFHTVRLRPNWFINSNTAKFVFTDCNWKTENEDISVKTELQAIGTDIPNAHKLLAKACWQLADNYEETKSFPEASLFRQISFDSERLRRRKRFGSRLKDTLNIIFEKRNGEGLVSIISNKSKRLFNLFKKSRLDSVHFLYRWLSGYGESWKWAFAVLIGIIFAFAMLYSSSFSLFDYGEKKNELVPETSDEIEKRIYEVARDGKRYHKMEFSEGIVYSLFVSAIQRPEPKPADDLTKFFVIIETILSPLQAALLALAIRRKFMR